jgi:hypothetical protein
MIFITQRECMAQIPPGDNPNAVNNNNYLLLLFLLLFKGLYCMWLGRNETVMNLPSSKKSC